LLATYWNLLCHFQDEPQADTPWPSNCACQLERRIIDEL